MTEPEHPSAENELVQQRIAKLDRLRAGGIDPYPPRFDRSHTATDVHQRMAGPDGEGTNASVGGRIVKRLRDELEKDMSEIPKPGLFDPLG